MSTEFGPAASRSVEANPLRLSNAFHFWLGGVNLVTGGVVAWLLAQEVQANPARLPMIAIAALLLVLGLHQIGRSWKDARFRIHPDAIGDFAVPAKFVVNGKPDIGKYAIDLLNSGVVPPPPGDSALLNKLYHWLPKLELAPQLVRWHAETQVLRSARLVVTASGFLLAWLFARPEVFALMAPLYLLLTINPLEMWRSFSMAGAQITRPPEPTPFWAVAILLFSVFAPILLAMVPAGVLPTPPWPTRVVVVPTVVAIVTILVASALFLAALRAQMRDLEASGVQMQVRRDVELPHIGNGLIERLQSDLPAPHRAIWRNTGWREGNAFGAHLLVETEPKLVGASAAGGAMEGLAQGLRDRQQRGLILLAAFGVASGLAATVLLALFSRSVEPTQLLSALALLSASQFALVTARGLWKRIDFVSTLYRIGYRGTFSEGSRVVGNSMTGSGSLSEKAVRIEDVEFKVAVVRVGSVAFETNKGPRFVQSIDLLPEECELQFARIADYHQDVMRRRSEAYQQEQLTRALVQGPAAPTATGPALVAPDPAAAHLPTKSD